MLERIFETIGYVGLFVFVVSLGFAFLIYRNNTTDTVTKDRVIFTAGGSLISLLFYFSSIYWWEPICRSLNMFLGFSDFRRGIVMLLLLFLVLFFIMSLLNIRIVRGLLNTENNHIYLNSIALVALYSIIITMQFRYALWLESTYSLFIFVIFILLSVSVVFACLIYRNDSVGNVANNRISFFAVGSFTSILLFLSFYFWLGILIYLFNDFIVIGLNSLILFGIMSLLNKHLYKQCRKNYFKNYISWALTALYSMIMAAYLIFSFFFQYAGYYS